MRNYSTLFFDLDDTLYQPHSGLWAAIRARIDQYMLEKVNIPPEKISTIREAFFHQYGTTLRGLQIEYQVNTLDYLDFVHDLPLSEFIKPDARLDQVLTLLPQKKVIFTNANRKHADRVLAILGVAHHFDTIIDILDIQPYCKPMQQAYQIALLKAGSEDPATCLMLDDSPVNIQGAANFGMDCILVSPSEKHADGKWKKVKNLYDLPDILSRE